jgi:hypothetical protein
MIRRDNEGLAAGYRPNEELHAFARAANSLETFPYLPTAGVGKNFENPEQNEVSSVN